MKAARSQASAAPEDLESQIRQFLDSCRQPFVCEPGERLLALRPGRYNLQAQQGGCLLEVWGEDGSLVRRIVAVERQTRGRLDVRARRFGQGQTSLSLVDRALSGEKLDRGAGQARFRERLRRLLARDFPAWKISQLAASANLEHSLSPGYTRAVMSRGAESWAVMGVSLEAGAAVCNEILTFGLIWLDFLRGRRPDSVLHGLKLFLPEGRTRITANRVAFLNRNLLAVELYAHDRQGTVCAMDERDFGNLQTELPAFQPRCEPEEPVASWLRGILALPDVEAVALGDGLLSLRVRGLPFAKVGRGVMVYGLDNMAAAGPGSLPQVTALARELARFRSADAADTLNPLYQRYPESWLESQVRRQLPVVGSALLPAPAYSHVPAIAGAERGILDLLACDRLGRLQVLELKASQDIHFPLQGLDYWMRVQWHLERGEFAQRGYFPGVSTSPQTPRLLLVCPAFEFHPTTETILRYFSPQVPVERIGLNADWRRELRVMFRAPDAKRLA